MNDPGAPNDPSSHDVVVSHELRFHRGTGRAFVAPSGALMVGYNDLTLTELTLHIQERCPLNLDALNVSYCGCRDRVERTLSVVERAPLGALIYLPATSVVNDNTVGDAYEDVGRFLGFLPNVERIFLLEPSVAETAVLVEAGYDVVHHPTLRPPDDRTWPRPASRRPRHRRWTRTRARGGTDR